MSDTEFYKTALQEALQTRLERNPRYSQAAFARTLGVVPSALSEILTGKRVPSYKMAKKMLGALTLPPEEQDHFLGSVAQAHRSRGLSRLNPVLRSLPTQPAPRQELSLELFRVIAEWYHTAILELSSAIEFRDDPHWIASELGISVVETKLALERLVKLGLLEHVEGRLVRRNQQFSTADKHLTTPALRKLQKQWLEKAQASLENDPIDERSHTGMTMTIDPAKLPQAREMIKNFNRALCDFLESGERKQVYNLAIALYPLQKKKKESLK